MVPEALNDRAADNWRPLLAIADLVGGFSPEEARRAARTLLGEEQDDAINIELLRDVRIAFGDADEIRSADLVSKLAADQERPCADWKNGRPADAEAACWPPEAFPHRLGNRSPAGLPDGKGTARADFEAAWDALRR